MKRAHCFPRKVRPVWEAAASGHAPGPEVAARVLTGCSIGLPAAPAERRRYASNSMAAISLSGGRRTQSGLRKTRGFSPSEGIHQC